MSKVEKIIKAMKINSKGISEWIEVKKLEKLVGFPLQGNGAAYLQNDRGLGLRYRIEKQYKKEAHDGT